MIKLGGELAKLESKFKTDSTETPKLKLGGQLAELEQQFGLTVPSPVSPAPEQGVGVSGAIDSVLGRGGTAAIRKAAAPLEAVLSAIDAPIDFVRGKVESGIKTVGALKRGDTDTALSELNQIFNITESGKQAVDAASKIGKPGAVFGELTAGEPVAREDRFTDFMEVLKEAGIPEGPELFSLPVIGPVSARGLTGFAMELLAGGLGVDEIVKSLKTTAKQAGKNLPDDVARAAVKDAESIAQGTPPASAQKATAEAVETDAKQIDEIEKAEIQQELAPKEDLPDIPIKADDLATDRANQNKPNTPQELPVASDPVPAAPKAAESAPDTPKTDKFRDIEAPAKTGEENPQDFLNRIDVRKKKPLPDEPDIDAPGIHPGKIAANKTVKASIVDFAERNADDIDTARRGRIPVETTEQAAKRIRKDYSFLIERERGQALNAEQLRAAEDVVVQTHRDAIKIAQAADPNNIEDVKAFTEKFLLAGDAQKQFAGARAEAGRALNILRRDFGNRGFKFTPDTPRAKRILKFDDNKLGKDFGATNKVFSKQTHQQALDRALRAVKQLDCELKL